jgi:curved DNA-binding protein CbpA
MPVSVPRPDLHAFMQAYAALEVPHPASPAEIRQSYKQLAKRHHPDRHATGSDEQRQATASMSAINAAYRLVREAPLRHHRLSTGARPEDPWSDVELDAAIRRARNDRMVDNAMSAVAVLFWLFLPWQFFDWTAAANRPYETGIVAVVFLGIAGLALRGPGISYRVFNLLEVFRLVTRY